MTVTFLLLFCAVGFRLRSWLVDGQYWDQQYLTNTLSRHSHQLNYSVKYVVLQSFSPFGSYRFA
ncbi:hypothetical protein [Gordonia paraffinivorans]|uniref:hypothetical protein n=1 Tax=Gordonia paraffinivorans TaxID=175628 RepID=UPI0012FC657B|nr:hypothetical protein [Gordonia paraffinivorans]